MTRPHPLTAMTERAWSQSWSDEQKTVDQLHDRGSWLPNVVEARTWGALRWTSGRPGHAATSGQAVPETFAVLRPDVAGGVGATEGLVVALRDVPPMFRFGGIGIRRHQLVGAAPGAAVGAVLLGGLTALLGAGLVVVIIVAVLGAALGAAGGAVVAHYADARVRAAALSDADEVRVVTGRYAPESWLRLVQAVTALEAQIGADAHSQTDEAMHVALWEAAGLLLGSSDHTGVDVLADGVERLAQAHRG